MDTERMWKTQDGRLIPYSELDDSHLQNIILSIRTFARRGVTDEKRELFGEEVLRLYDYYGLLYEAKRREIKGRKT